MLPTDDVHDAMVARALRTRDRAIRRLRLLFAIVVAMAWIGIDAHREGGAQTYAVLLAASLSFGAGLGRAPLATAAIATTAWLADFQLGRLHFDFWHSKAIEIFVRIGVLAVLLHVTSTLLAIHNMRAQLPRATLRPGR
ncbi:MAG TPA: hypothetical protein VL463_00610 [Kofleriaceae bacterium]|nr:hypothetical protein [Kofleriaceae bacterium]